MQYKVQLGRLGSEPGNLVFFICDSTRILEIAGVWTTDGNAASNNTQFFRGGEGLNYVDRNIIRTDPCYSREYVRKKAAEVLVPNHLPASCITRICVRYPCSAEKLEQLTQSTFAGPLPSGSPQLK